MTDDPTPSDVAQPDVGSWTRPARAAIVWAVVIAIIGGLVTWRVVHDERRAASVGQVTEASDELPGAKATFVLVPSARLDILATTAVDDVDGDADVRSVQAPDDGSFVGLQISLRDPSYAPADADPLALSGVSTSLTQYAPSLTLIADGRRYPLKSDEGREDLATVTPPGRWYVAVAGEPSTLELEVSVESYEQRVNLRTGERHAGVFAPLYDTAALNRDRPRSCGAATLSPSFRAEGVGPTCRVGTLLRTPLLAGQGWAASGRTWLVMHVDVTAAAGYLYRTSNGKELRFDRVREPEVQFRLLGSREASVSDSPSGEGLVVAFEVPATATAFGVLGIEAAAGLARNYSASSAERVYPPDAVTRWRVAL